MKWFKHHCDAHDNKKLIPLLRRAGVEGYGRYWLLCEFIGAHVAGKSGHIVTLFPEDCAKILHTKREQCRNFLNICAELDLLSFDGSGNKWTIEMAKLLEIRDEYSRKSGQAPDTLPTDSGQYPELIDKRENKKEKESPAPQLHKNLLAFNDWILKREGELMKYFETSYAHLGGVKHLKVVVKEIREAIFLDPESSKYQWNQHRENESWGEVIRGWNRTAIRSAV